MNQQFEINGKAIDLSIALPLTMGDWEDLEDEGVTIDKLNNDKGGISFKTMTSFLLHICKKANDNVDRNDIRSMSMDTMHTLLEKVNPKSDGVRDQKK